MNSISQKGTAIVAANHAKDGADRWGAICKYNGAGNIV